MLTSISNSKIQYPDFSPPQERGSTITRLGNSVVSLYENYTPTLPSLKEKVSYFYSQMVSVVNKVRNIWKSSNDTEWETRSLGDRNITITPIPEEEEDSKLDEFFKNLDF